MPAFEDHAIGIDDAERTLPAGKTRRFFNPVKRVSEARRNTENTAHSFKLSNGIILPFARRDHARIEVENLPSIPAGQTSPACGMAGRIQRNQILRFGICKLPLSSMGDGSPCFDLQR